MKKLKGLLLTLPYLAVGGICGLWLVRYLGSTDNFFLAMGLLLVWFYISLHR